MNTTNVGEFHHSQEITVSVWKKIMYKETSYMINILDI